MSEDEFEDVVPTLTTGSASVASGDDEEERPLLALWVPDPEQRHWWREWYVKPAKPKPNGKPIGFNRGK